MDKDSIQFIKENYNESIFYLSKKTGYCEQTIRNELKKLNLYKPGKRLSEDDVNYIINHPYESISDLAEKLGFSKTAIENVRLKNNIRIHPKHIHYW